MSAATLWLIAAILAQGVLLFIITGVLYRKRIPLIVKGSVRVAEIAVEKNNWPEPSRLAANSYENQFEMPVLFYVATILGLYLGATPLEVVLAWAFVVSRYVHAFIHLTSNHVVRRFFAFITGVGFVAIFWIELTVRLAMLAGASAGP